MKITENRKFNLAGIRRTCIENNLFTCGDDAAYQGMLNLAGDTIPTPEGLYKVATFIADHSDDETVENVMFLLANNAVYYTYQIEL